MIIRFDSSVSDHRFALKCIPINTSRQSIDNLNVNIKYTDNLNYDKDNFGNVSITGRIIVPHNEFFAEVTGTAITGIDIFEEYQYDLMQSIIYKYPTGNTTPGDELQSYYDSLQLEKQETVYDKVLHIMHSLNRDFEYEKGATEITTTAEQAMALGKGVCQDYAQIMVALCRMAGIPARYVVGMMIGEGESHAWVETLCGNYWYGFDPTNNQLIDDRYIKISCGRDFNDCSVNKGVFKGFTAQHQDIKINVTECTY